MLPYLLFEIRKQHGHPLSWCKQTLFRSRRSQRLGFSLRHGSGNPEADAKAQTENVLAQIDSWLAQCQSDKAHILEATIYLPDMNDYAAMNEAWDAWTAPERAPARACVEAKLASPDWKVEIKITALQIK